MKEPGDANLTKNIHQGLNPRQRPANLRLKKNRLIWQEL